MTKEIYQQKARPPKSVTSQCIHCDFAETLFCQMRYFCFNLTMDKTHERDA